MRNTQHKFRSVQAQPPASLQFPHRWNPDLSIESPETETNRFMIQDADDHSHSQRSSTNHHHYPLDGQFSESIFDYTREEIHYQEYGEHAMHDQFQKKDGLQEIGVRDDDRDGKQNTGIENLSENGRASDREKGGKKG